MAVAIVAACIFAFGLVGMINHAVKTPMSATVISSGDAYGFTYLEGAERFVSFAGDGAQVDEKGLYTFAKAEGLEDDAIVHIVVAMDVPRKLLSLYMVGESHVSTVGELKDGEIFIPGWSVKSVKDFLYSIL